MAFNQKKPPIKLKVDKSFYNLIIEILSSNENVNADDVDKRAKKLKEKLLKYPRIYNDEDRDIVSMGFFPGEASDMIDQLLVYLAVNYEISLDNDYYSILAERNNNQKTEEE